MRNSNQKVMRFLQHKNSSWDKMSSGMKEIMKGFERKKRFMVLLSGH
jgi:hypothetical protein